MWMLQHEYASALVLVLDVHLRRETVDAQSALELVNDALQQVRFCILNLYCSMLK
jgi:hypothetical protein